MKIEIKHQCADAASYRSARVKSLFNVDDGSEFTAAFDIPIEEKDWQIGLIVGPSGSGKTSIGSRFFDGADLMFKPAWPKDKPIIDVIAPNVTFDQVTTCLTAVGLGSVPPWLRPHHVLSNGEKFRADLARLLCERPSAVVVDEFTSVVDRQIARIGALAFGKAWRRGPGQVVLLSCHYDVAGWLKPDWVFDTATGKFTGRYLRCRPDIELEVFETDWAWWPLFEKHHYLNLPKMIAATCYVGFINKQPVAHIAFSPRPGLVEARCARFVVMPEWQGIGIGTRFLNAVCAEWRRGNNRYEKPMPTLINTAHPGITRALRRDPLWTQVSAKLFGDNRTKSMASIRRSQKRSGKRPDAYGYGGHFRSTQGFRYIEGIG